jgi:hypothetical protein
MTEISKERFYSQKYPHDPKNTVYAVFPRQALAFEFFDGLELSLKRQQRVKIFSYESKLNGKRRFLVASFDRFFAKYFEHDDSRSKSKCNHGHYYEIIRELFPCR